MLITDSYLGNKFTGLAQQSDSYDDFVKKKRGGPAPRPAGAPQTKREQRKANNAQKKETRKQGAPEGKKPRFFGKKKAAATGINSPVAKKTGLFGIKKKQAPAAPGKKPPFGFLNKKKHQAPAPVQAAPMENLPEEFQNENAAFPGEAENLASDASSDLNQINDTAPGPETLPETSGDNEPESDTSQQPEEEPQAEGGYEEDQYYYAYEHERSPRTRHTRRYAEYDRYDESGKKDTPSDKGNAKPDEKPKESNTLGVILGFAAVGLTVGIIIYVVTSGIDKQEYSSLHKNY